MASGGHSSLLALEIAAIGRATAEIGTDLRALIRRMSVENPLWVAEDKTVSTASMPKHIQGMQGMNHQLAAKPKNRIRATDENGNDVWMDDPDS